ncbi:hypothetical protein FN846DRAFT_586802 [Sphaerosporella brunnea]|uniref:Uncharacterized protein n=1 Tax=Sphaerosporella brunnea TaxID=1250544 RepID=A0A5J5F1C4_9PEZI|nr:hypothetical protein FN846DRAFT_586802 [Sphaerosporella brunnea]
MRGSYCSSFAPSMRITPGKVYTAMHSMTRQFFQHTNGGQELAALELFTAETKQRFCDVIGTWDFSDEVVAAFCRRGTICDNLREWLMYMLFKSIRKTVKKNPKGARRMVQSSRSPLSSPEVGWPTIMMTRTTSVTMIPRMTINSGRPPLRHHRP